MYFENWIDWSFINTVSWLWYVPSSAQGLIISHDRHRDHSSRANTSSLVWKRASLATSSTLPPSGHPSPVRTGSLIWVFDEAANKNKANDCGTHISYRVPKSALNALSISVAIELKAAKENIAVLCIDPGDVPTKLSRWAGDIDLNDSVHGMFEQIERATIEDTGLFVNWKGRKWPYG